MRYILAALFSLGFLSVQAQACLRADVEDRSPKQVVAQAHALAKSHKYSPVIGLLTVHLERGVLNSSGIAIDPYTILTAAHFASEVGNSGAMISFDPKCEAGITKTSYKGSKIFIHPDFKRLQAKPLFMKKSEDGTIELYGVKLSNLKDLTFQQYRDTFPEETRVYKGPDLAIVKLEKPLSVKDYPEFLNSNVKLDGSPGYTIGYSHLRVCHPVQPTQLMEEKIKGFNKHLILSKVSEHEEATAKFLYGKYCGRLVDGSLNFIPDPNMMKTEGMPIPGDSGAPFFVKIDGKDYLAGIFASISTCNHPVFPENDERELVKDFIQPIFPVWMDVRPYIGWIQAYMGKTKN